MQSKTSRLDSLEKIIMGMEFLNRWLFFPWVKDNNMDKLIHPEDLSKVDSIGIAHCIDFNNEYLVLQDKNKIIRVKKEGVKTLLPNPVYNWNENVCKVSKPEIKAQIDDLFWHHNKREFLYYLKINGKRKSKRYSENELKSLDKT